jgi:peptide chain release factor 1
MKPSIQLKLENLGERFEEITALLSQPGVQNNQNQFRSLSQEYAQLEPIVGCYKAYQNNEAELVTAK